MITKEEMRRIHETEYRKMQARLLRVYADAIDPQPVLRAAARSVYSKGKKGKRARHTAGGAGVMQ